MRKRFLVAAAATLVGIGASFAAAQLTGAGATFPYPLYSKWISVYAAKTGVQINYQSIGSGGGIQQLKQRTVDFAGSDAPLSNEEMKSMPDVVLHLPTCFGAVTLAYNLPVAGLNLDKETLAGIYLGEIKVWNDPKIAALNKGKSLPSDAITVVHRSDGSGTTYIFTDYLSHVSPTWHDKVGRNKSVNWPTGVGGKGNEGVAGVVRQQVGAIGYVELAYANKNDLKVAALKNRAGTFVKPTLNSTTEAAAGAAKAMQKDVRVSLVNQPGKFAYPIVGATYILLYLNQTRGEKTSALLTFLSWAFRDGQSYCKALDYAPLPKEIQALNAKILGAVKQR